MQEYYKNYATEELVGMYQSSHNEAYLQEIIRRNNGLLHSWVRDYNNIPYHDEADLLGEATVALWRAVEDYDPNKGYAFSSCLKGYIKQRFNRLYNDATRKKRYAGAEPVSYEELEEIHREVSIDFELLSDLAVQEFINSLEEDSTVQYIAISLLEGKNKKDIARSLGITPASTSYHVKKLQSLAIRYFGLVGSRSPVEAF